MTISIPLRATPDDEAYMNGLHCPVPESIRPRVIIERAIVRRAMTDLLAAGYQLRMHDGEDWSHEPTLDLGIAMAAMMATDEETLYAYKHFPDQAAWKPVASIFLVYGNDGWDVIADYSVKLEELLKGANELAEAIAGSH